MGPELVLTFIALFIGVPLVWHWFRYDRADVSARSALLLGVGCGIFAWVQQSWAIGLLVFFLVTLIEFGIAYTIGLFYGAFASAERTDRLEAARSRRESPLFRTAFSHGIVRAPSRSQVLALGGLAALLLLEALALHVPAQWLAQVATDQFSSAWTIFQLRKCSPDVAMLKGQHFALSTMFIPLKVAFLFLLWPVQIRAPGTLALAQRWWAGFVYALYCLLGLAATYMLLVGGFAWAPPFGRGNPMRALYHLCAPPTWDYLVSHFFISLVGAICLWPIAAALVRLSRRRNS